MKENNKNQEKDTESVSHPVERVVRCGESHDSTADIKKALISLLKDQLGFFFIKDDGSKEWHAFETDKDCVDTVFDIMNIFSRAI